MRSLVFWTLRIRRPSGLVFDTGHYVFGSGDCDVAAGLNRFKDRIWYVHLKDCSQELAGKITPSALGLLSVLTPRYFLRTGTRLCQFSGGAAMAQRSQLRRLCSGGTGCSAGNGGPKDSALRNREYLRSLEPKFALRPGRRKRLTERDSESESSARAESAGCTREPGLPHPRSGACRDCRHNGDAAREVAERCGIPRVVTESKEILNDPAIDAVLICSPTETHANLIVEAARAGKHIFCEKPIDHSLSNIDRALQEVKKSGVKLQVGFNRRFDANFVRVREASRARRDRDGTPDAHHQP